MNFCSQYFQSHNTAKIHFKKILLQLTDSIYLMMFRLINKGDILFHTISFILQT